MEIGLEMIVLLIIMIILLVIFAYIFETIQSFLEVLVGKPLRLPIILFAKKLDPRSESLLTRHFSYYSYLRGLDKRRFANRVARFQQDKLFRIDKKVPDAQLAKLLIAATAVKVCFGLRNYLFPTFHTIVVHSQSYYSRYTKSVNYGETNQAGFIVFAWNAFLFGVKDNKDSLNLGYHEFGHALYVEHLKLSMEPVFSNNFEKWERFVKNQSKMREVKDHGIFREYATHNIQEFFAVSVENFFEKPKEFKAELPQLYKLMAKMLNQNPLQKTKQLYHQV
jgi:Mlc titration factor MtfA (ptsG expression regulator)